MKRNFMRCYVPVLTVIALTLGFLCLMGCSSDSRTVRPRANNIMQETLI